jgi:hypothetical protein
MQRFVILGSHIRAVSMLGPSAHERGRAMHVHGLLPVILEKP